jgi:hypothetical protein
MEKEIVIIIVKQVLRSIKIKYAVSPIKLAMWIRTKSASFDTLRRGGSPTIFGMKTPAVWCCDRTI